MNNHWESPRLWIETHPGDGSLHVVPQTALLLQQITQHVVVVAVAGKLRTGKSYLMNRLAGKDAGFALGSTIEAKTKGIWIWCLWDVLRNNQVLVLIDTEGLGDPGKGDEKNDISIFSLAVLLSSTFIFNIMGNIDQKMIDDLYLVTQLTERIKVKSSQDEDEDVDLNELTEFLPCFIVLVRDFILELKLNDRPVTANEYFDYILTQKSGSGRKTLEYNLPRLAIRNAFKSHSCFTFTRPVGTEEEFKLLSENKVSEVNLSSKFLSQSNDFCHHIYSTSSVKTLKRGQAVSGRVLSTLAEEYVKVINLGAIPCIESTVTLVAQRENDRVHEESIKLYKDAMSCLQFPTDIEEIISKHQEAFENSTDHFSGNVIFDDENEFMEKFMIALTQSYNEFLKKNEEESTQKCEKLINELYDSTITTKVSNKEYARSGGYKLYCADIDHILGVYDNTPGKGINADEVRNSFLKEKEAHRAIIMHADSEMSEKDKELEELMFDKITAEMEAAATAKKCEDEKLCNERLKKDHEVQLQKLKTELEKKSLVEQKNLHEEINKLHQEQKRLMQEGFVKQSQELVDKIKMLDNSKVEKSTSEKVFGAIEKVTSLIPAMVGMKYLLSKK